MPTQVQTLPLLPFHASILKEMDPISPSVKDGRARAVAAARMIATTLCPKNRDFVRAGLTAMLDLFGGQENKRWTTKDRSWFNHAFKALDRQDAEEAGRRLQHEGSGVMHREPRGDVESAAPGNGAGITHRAPVSAEPESIGHL